MTRKNLPYISPSGRFNPYLYRRYKRDKGYNFIHSHLDQLVKSPLVKNVPTEEPFGGSVLSPKYSQNSNSSKHMNSVEAGIKSVVNSITVPRGESAAIANNMRDDLTEVFESKGYRGNLLLYGSYFYELCSTHSDVDFIFECRENASGKSPKDIPNSIEKILQSSESFSNVKLIKKAKVEFIECVHNRSKKKCNITFENKIGIPNSKLIKLYLTLNPNLRILTLYFKHLLDMYGILERGRFTGHILVWIVIFFMQQKGLLPPVKTVREACRSAYIVSGTNCAVPESFDYRMSAASTPKIRLYSLVLDFAVFCRDFRFMKYVMSPHFGEAYPIDQVGMLKENNNGSRNFSTSFINLQHPSDLEFNLSRQTGKRSVNVFKIMCCHISKILLQKMRYNDECDRTLDDVLPKNVEKLPYVTYQPKELIQYASFTLKESSEDLPNRVFKTVRIMMENVFGFKATKIVKKSVDQDGQNNVSTVYYFSYSSTPEIWSNDRIRLALSPPKLNKKGEPDQQISVFLICEIKDNKMIDIKIEGDAHFMIFIDENPRLIEKKDCSNRYDYEDMFRIPRKNVHGKNLFGDILAKTF